MADDMRNLTSDEIKKVLDETPLVGRTDWTGDLEKVVLNLQKHFGRLPTDREVYHFVYGSAETRNRIYENKGLTSFG